MATQAEIEEAKQAAKDAKDAPKIDAAYNKAMTNTPAAKAPAKKFAKGGFVRAADGIASKGKTRGKIC
jgi:hypothetical protein